MGPHGVLMLQSGQYVRLDDPWQTTILEEDLFWGLANYRYAGHIPVTIMAHLAICVRLAQIHPDATPLRVALAGAHDLHEAYLGDLTYIWKRALPIIDQIERPWQARLQAHFGLPLPRSPGEDGPGFMTPDDEAFVGTIDSRAVAVEAVTWGHPHADHFTEKHGGPLNETEWSIGRWVWGRSGGPVENLWRTVVKPALEAGRTPS